MLGILLTQLPCGKRIMNHVCDLIFHVLPTQASCWDILAGQTLKRCKKLSKQITGLMMLTQAGRYWKGAPQAGG